MQLTGSSARCRRAACAVAALGFVSAIPAEATDAWPLLQAMERAVGELGDYTTVLVKQERFGGRLEREQRLAVKWARPFRLYMKVLDGDNPGQEVLFVRGWNEDRLRVHKGSFPDITINLDPRGALATSRTHHPGFLDRSASTPMTNGNCTTRSPSVCSRRAPWPSR
jgi:hypothetical protein